LTPLLAAGCLAPEPLHISAPFVHVVLFKMKPDAPAKAKDDMIADMEMLAGIPAVKSLWVGFPAPTKTPARPMVDDDYDVGLLILVAHQAGLEEYSNHPRHVKFVEKYGSQIDVRVFDFTPRAGAPVGTQTGRQ
jgi:hypothetical protein